MTAVLLSSSAPKAMAREVFMSGVSLSDPRSAGFGEKPSRHNDHVAAAGVSNGMVAAEGRRLGPRRRRITQMGGSRSVNCTARITLMTCELSPAPALEIERTLVPKPRPDKTLEGRNFRSP
jgi:hypothetical protein